MILYYAIIVMI